MSDDVLTEFRREILAVETRLNARLARLETEIYGDDKNDAGLKARVANISEMLIEQRWHGYALIGLLLLSLVSLVLIGLLFIRVY